MESKVLALPPIKEAEYYEEKIDKILTKKFPSLAKIVIRVRVVLSEIMILFILIVQTMILAFQSQANIMFWGFLFFSLILQAYVISSSYGNIRKPVPAKKNEDAVDREFARQEEVLAQKELEKNNLKKFIRLSRVLRYYSGFVLIAQIAYFFIMDDSFLGQYGFDDQFEKILTDVGIWNYICVIGFTECVAKTPAAQDAAAVAKQEDRSVISAFLIPIVFYITASILKDYFSEKNS